MEANTQQLDKDSIINFYMEDYLEQGSKPKSVYHFAKTHHFAENEFYQIFGSLEAIEKEIFTKFLDNSVALLDQDVNYATYGAREKMLSFYFTFFENLSANRSFVTLILKANSNPLKNLAQLSSLRISFKQYVTSILGSNSDTQVQKIKSQAIEESAWLQLLMTIQFWLSDESPSFEKTDIFIEKSVNASFELLEASAFKSVLDFGKFLYHEKVQSK